MRLILLGPAGAGKGTQARLISEAQKIPHLSSGDIFREMAQEDSDLGRTIKTEIDAGNLISDEILINMIKEVINSSRCENGFILDGFVRTQPQAEALDDMLKGLGKELDVVVSLLVDGDKLVKRLTGRFTCDKCGEGYHDEFKKPATADVCDVCQGTVFSRRADDTEEGIKTRLQAYHDITAPIIPHYEAQGKLRSLDGMKSIEEVQSEIQGILSEISS